MKIETKFELDEKVVLIENDRIIILPVKAIEYVNRTIRYTFCSSKAATNLDRDKMISRNEIDCFKSINELAKFYEEANGM